MVLIWAQNTGGWPSGGLPAISGEQYAETPALDTYQAATHSAVARRKSTAKYCSYKLATGSASEDDAQSRASFHLRCAAVRPALARPARCAQGNRRRDALDINANGCQNRQEALPHAGELRGGDSRESAAQPREAFRADDGSCGRSDAAEDCEGALLHAVDDGQADQGQKGRRGNRGVAEPLRGPR
ncbi:uncharacterized protein BcabD6B2_03960 [Babesia caballi]|uniref:Uncharacterized protein n=1 Tax=Babesia caballi TaxID=5871 RepID=A0AAV4LLU2_BABCB|nr:hypothetical protein BcabD6B2_03960 [Babesia caballi]